MAEVFRPAYDASRPATGKQVRKRIPNVTWIRYYTPDGKRHKVKGYRDKKATESQAAELERRGIRLDAGLVDPPTFTASAAGRTRRGLPPLPGRQRATRADYVGQ